MRILFFCRLFYPHGGGVERHVLEISKRLVAKGHKVTVITEEMPKTYNVNYQSNTAGAKITGRVNSAESSKYSSSDAKAESRSRFWTSQNDGSRLRSNSNNYFGIEVYNIPAGRNDWFKKFRIWGWLISHKNLIENADVVHTHDVFFWYFPFRFLYPTKPAYITYHGWETVFPPTKKAIFVRKLSEILAWGNICVGDFIRKWYGTRPTYITYGGVDKAQNSKLKTQNYSIKLKVIFIGRFEEDLGVKTYLDALDALKKRGVAYEFEVYGEGSLKKNLQEYGDVYEYSLGIVEKAIEQTDVVFASSYLTILQVMSAKRLVCSVYDNPLKKDYLEMAPFAKWIVIESSGEKLAEKIISLFGRLPPFDNAQGKLPRNDMIEQGYTWVKEQTWEKVTNIYLKLWIA